jgi:protein-disulfide isomerase
MAIGRSRLARLQPPLSERDHVQGPATAAALLVEYGDYQCPFCAQAHPIVKAVQARLGGQMRFAFRHFPLTEIHPRAVIAAEAAEAAGAQGRFWEMHDRLFENQPAFDDADLVRYGQALGLDMPRFVGEIAEHVWEPRIREQFMSGVRSGVNGTPTFFINGTRHDGPWDADTLTDALTAAVHAHA